MFALSSPACSRGGGTALDRAWLSAEPAMVDSVCLSLLRRRGSDLSPPPRARGRSRCWGVWAEGRRTQGHLAEGQEDSAGGGLPSKWGFREFWILRSV